ncbi:hypothetical protein OL548_21300 [Lysinibacillus sp. MHQ-1]|nr:hypothetical protein OL548_21300 [Lysinibacillus sp. MHQ-1]
MSYLWQKDGKVNPITVDVLKVKRKWTVNEELRTIDMSYTIDVEVEEFPHDHLYKDEIFQDVQQMIEEKMQAEFEEVLRILQNQKSDTLGIGRYIRAYHPNMFKEEDWHTEFSSLLLKPKVDVKNHSNRSFTLKKSPFLELRIRRILLGSSHSFFEQVASESIV